MEELNTFSRLLETLHNQPVLTLFLILGMGYLIGGIRIGSFSLGPVAGVLFAGLFLGHFDFANALTRLIASRTNAFANAFAH